MQLNLRRNAISSIIEVVCSSVVLFLIYKLIVTKLGIELLGIWSLVLATTSLMRLADTGAAIGLARYVAKSSERPETLGPRDYIDTALLGTTGLYLFLAVASYWPSKLGLGYVIHSPTMLKVSEDLLPFAIFSFVLGNIAGTTTAILVGLQRSDLKSLVAIGGYLVLIVSSVTLIPGHGLVGLALAQIVQNCFVMLLASSIAHFLLYSRFGLILPFKWHNKAFRNLIGYGLKLQVSGIINFLYDPFTKFLMSTFGGLEATGIFEMANRLVFQTRAILASPTQTLVPAFAHLSESAPQEVRTLYAKSITLLTVTAVPLFLGLAITSPLLSILLLGQVSWLFVAFMILLCFAWLANLLSAPGYLLGVGIGKVRWNIVGHLVTTAGCLFSGWLLGFLFGSIGIALSAAVSLLLGSILTALMNCRDQNIRPFLQKTDIRDFFRSFSGNNNLPVSQLALGSIQ
ncbi:MAG: hypothetical protein JWQ94_1421, partial [Tardiphaga sp.]|nr:hypothetical protein [Tardiphaga sp.]